MQKDFASAAEIDLRKFQNRPARIVPSSASYFTAVPKTTDIIIGLERLLAKYQSLPTVHANNAPRMAWLRAPDLTTAINEEIPRKKYRTILKLVQRLNLIEPALAPQELRVQLEQFLRPGNPYGNRPAPQQVDEMGRSRGKGRRKTCAAVAHLVEGDGEFMVNGKSLQDTFGRLHDRESASWALRITQRLDKYNVFAITKGGGVTGQAEAIMLAVARALIVHEPGLKTYLRKSTCILLPTYFLYTDVLQLVLSRSIVDKWKERSRVAARPARCPSGSRGELSVFLYSTVYRLLQAVYHVHCLWSV